MEGVELHPVRDASGINRFDPDEVEAVARGQGNRDTTHRAAEFMDRLRDPENTIEVEVGPGDELYGEAHDRLGEMLANLRDERERRERLIASERRQREEEAKAAAKERREEEAALALAILETYDEDEFDDALEDGDLDELLELLEDDE